MGHKTGAFDGVLRQDVEVGLSAKGVKALRSVSAGAVIIVGGDEALIGASQDRGDLRTAEAPGGEDIALVARSADLITWRTATHAPAARVRTDLGNQLTTKLVAYGYSAFTAGRFPAAVGRVGGLDTTTNGMVTPDCPASSLTSRSPTPPVSR